MPVNKGSARGYHQPPVGVVARTKGIAESMIRELGLRNAIAINTTGEQVRGKALRALVVDDGVWPMSAELEAAVLPALDDSAGYVMHLSRHDPRPKRRRRLVEPAVNL
jgi:hypothetical protein